MTFRELLEFSDRLAIIFSKSGVNDQSTVVLTLPNGRLFVQVIVALMKIRARMALVSTQYGDSEIKAILARLHPSLIVSDATFAAKLLATVPSDVPEHRSIVSRTLDGMVLIHLRNTEPLPMPAGTSLLKVTSGSTGDPKIVALSGENVAAAAQIVVDSMEYTPDDRILCVTPMCHSYGFDLGVLGMLASGATLIPHSLFVPRRVLRQVHSENISIFLGVPGIYRTLNELRMDTVPDLRNVRYMLSCTAPLSSRVILEFHQRYGVPICQHYGSSETGAVALHIPSKVLERMHSVGAAMQGVSMEIVDEKGSRVPPAVEGEIMVTSGAVSHGYVGQPNDSSRCSNGSIRMADTGKMDADGFLHLSDRLDNIINIDGFKISPIEIARVLETCGSVREAAVSRVMDNHGQTAIYAAVVLTQPASERDLLLFCRSHLAEYKIPRRIEILDELPRGPFGKVRLRTEDIRL